VIGRSGWWLGAAAFAVGIACGCASSAQFQCASSEDCRADGGDGICQADGYCSFFDLDCPSQQRYGDHAGDGKSGECVPLDPEATGGPATTTGGPGDDSTTTGDDDSGVDDSSTGADVGAVSISDGPLFDFGFVTLGEAPTHEFLVTNAGATPATGLVATDLQVPFRWAGGLYPGTGGSCTDALDARADCTIVVTFEPATLGPRSDALVLTYDDGMQAGQATRQLRGAGAGTSPNLVVNGGAESGDDPPSGWAVVSGDWQSSDGTECDAGGVCVVTAHGGSQFFFPGEAPDAGEVVYELEQVVDVATFQDAIATGSLRLDFTAWGRTHNTVWDTSYRFEVLYRDASGAVIDSATFQIDWTQDNPVWTEYADAKTAPADTREIVIRLFGRKGAGSYINSYFDDVSLYAVYPP
jgi:hypothetical protein